MSKVKYTIAGSEIEVSVPFLLKNVFKEKFRTAKWNRLKKVWIVTHSDTTIEKLEKFFSASAVLNFDELAERDSSEKSIAAFERGVQIAIEKIQHELSLLPSTLQIQEDLKKASIEFCEKRKEASRLRSKRLAAEKLIQTELDEIMRHYGTKEKILKLMQLRKATPTSSNGCMARSIQGELRDIYFDIEQNYGIKIYTLLGLGNLNWNRPDRDSVIETAQGLYSNIGRVSLDPVVQGS